MSIFRKKRVDLTQWDADWADSYVLLKMDGLNQTLQMQKQIRENRKLMEKMQKDALTLEGKKLEELTEKAEALETKMVEDIVGMISSHFIGGMIYDGDLKATREMTAEDIASFDMEVLNNLLNELLGSVPKA